MITFRNAGSGDIEKMVALCAETLPERWSADSFAAELDKNSVVLCAVDNDIIVAFSVTALSIDEGYLDLIAVHPDYRRQGIARRLLYETERALKLHNATRIILDVRCSNDAVELYKSCGYSQICTRRDFYSNPREDGFTMQKELE